MPTIFVSHDSEVRSTALSFKSLLLEGSNDLEVFLSSDSDSIRSGSLWLQEIERALATHTHFVALITSPKDAENRWISYEVGFARGRGLLPKIFVFGSTPTSQIGPPIALIQFVGTWDTSRWVTELRAMGVFVDKNKEAQLARLFRQTSPALPPST